jgi:hypothetical protein
MLFVFLVGSKIKFPWLQGIALPPLSTDQENQHNNHEFEVVLTRRLHSKIGNMVPN